MTLLLAADIGGTKSDLAIVTLNQRADALPLRQKRYKNSEFNSFNTILRDFLHDSPVPEYGCMGVAAVISGGIAKLTNLDWTLSEHDLRKQFAFKQVSLINDLSAVCASLPLLQDDDLLTIQRGNSKANGIQAVIAPGTGLGEGFLIRHKNCFFPQGSEGGHADFAPLNREQEQLLSFMHRKYEDVSYELLCSGLGIPNIFDFFAKTTIPRNSVRLTVIEQAADRTQAIVAGASQLNPCPLCQKTVSVFLEILGAEAGNLALKTLCTDGIFIGGGILPRIASQVSFTPFLKNFRRKEKMKTLMASIPVHIIMRNDAALLGSVHYGQYLFQTGA